MARNGPAEFCNWQSIYNCEVYITIWRLGSHLGFASFFKSLRQKLDSTVGTSRLHVRNNKDRQSFQSASGGRSSDNCATASNRWQSRISICLILEAYTPLTLSCLRMLMRDSQSVGHVATCFSNKRSNEAASADTGQAALHGLPDKPLALRGHVAHEWLCQCQNQQLYGTKSHSASARLHRCLI